MPSARFGQLLREARELRGLTREQLSSETHIPLGHIEALEAGRVDALPGAMYRRAEARAYAEAVGLDPRMVLDALRRAEEESANPIAVGRASSVAVVPAPLPPSEPNPDTARFARALLVLAVGCGALLWQQTDEPPGAAATATATTMPALPIADAIGEAVAAAALPSVEPTIKPVLFDPRIAVNGKRWRRDARLDQGVLVVHSTPRGARVTVNGVGWGRTPIAIRYLPEGHVRVRVAKDRFRSAERIVAVRDGQPSRVAIRLRPLS